MSRRLTSLRSAGLPRHLSGVVERGQRHEVLGSLFRERHKGNRRTPESRVQYRYDEKNTDRHL